MKLLAILAFATLTVGAGAHDDHNLTMQKLANFVGGTWTSTMPDGSKVSVRYTYLPDRHTIQGNGTLTTKAGKVLHTHTIFGMDDAAKRPFYFDTHAGSPVFGHITLDKDSMVFRFGPAGKPPQFDEVGYFSNKDTYVFTVKDMKGKVVASNSMRRTR